MIVTRGFNSRYIITRGYGGILLDYGKAVCNFTKEIINKLFFRSEQINLFKRKCG